MKNYYRTSNKFMFNNLDITVGLQPKRKFRRNVDFEQTTNILCLDGLGSGSSPSIGCGKVSINSGLACIKDNVNCEVLVWYHNQNILIYYYFNQSERRSFVIDNKQRYMNFSDLVYNGIASIRKFAAYTEVNVVVKECRGKGPDYRKNRCEEFKNSALWNSPGMDDLAREKIRLLALENPPADAYEYLILPELPFVNSTPSIPKPADGQFLNSYSAMESECLSSVYTNPQIAFKVLPSLIEYTYGQTQRVCDLQYVVFVLDTCKLLRKRGCATSFMRTLSIWGLVPFKIEEAEKKGHGLSKYIKKLPRKIEQLSDNYQRNKCLEMKKVVENAIKEAESANNMCA